MSWLARPLVWRAAVLAGGYAVLALGGDLKSRPGLYLSVHFVLFAVYLSSWAAARRDRDAGPGRATGAVIVIGSALLFRLILLPATPSLSDDIYRYIWEGRLQLNGINPYGAPPSDPRLAPYRDRFWDGINNKDLPAIYPPAMQWALALGALPGATPVSMKIPFIAADMALILLLAALLRERRKPAANLLLYAWSPLVVVEVAGSGHNDPLALLFLVAATLVVARRRLLSMGWLGLSALCKLLPLALLPLFARRIRAWYLVIPPLLLVAGYVPYIRTGGDPLQSPRAYAERWRFNESLFAVIEMGISVTGLPETAKRWADTLGVDSLYAQPHMLARGAAGLIAMVVLAGLALGRGRWEVTLERGIFLFTGAVLLLSPIVHPWYLLWILPWIVLFPSPAWIALSGLIPVVYTGAGWARPVEYGVFLALLAGGLVLRVRRSGRDGRMVELGPQGRNAG